MYMAAGFFNVVGSDVSVVLQDANECWLQMVRVLQQKLEPLEPETPMEVSLLSSLLSLSIFISDRPRLSVLLSVALWFQTEGESGAVASTTKKNFIDQYFGVEFETTYPYRLLSCDISNQTLH